MKKTAGHGSVRNGLIGLLRLIVGGVLVFSGFVKAVDPWGGLYKISDYFAAWGITLPQEYSLILACLLSGFEFVLGVMLVLGCYRRGAALLALIFMTAMTLLTLYIWIADPVADCGCFGDAIKLSNSATFLKNIILLALTWLLWRFNKSVPALIHHRLQWLCPVITAFYIIAVQIYGYNIQPLIDFRPYPIGTDLAAMTGSQAEDEPIEFVYEKDGERQTFSADELPDDTWTFVERIDNGGNGSQSSAQADTRSHSLAVFDLDGDDVTEEIFLPDSLRYVLIVNDPERYGMSRSESANALYDYTATYGAEMFAIVGGGPEQAGRFMRLAAAQYPVYWADDTDLKEIARGEAALMAVENGKIKWKSNIYALSPRFPEAGHEVVITDFAGTGHSPLILLTLSWIVLLLIVYLVSRYTKIIASPRKRSKI